MLITKVFFSVEKVGIHNIDFFIVVMGVEKFNL